MINKKTSLSLKIIIGCLITICTLSQSIAKTTASIDSQSISKNETVLLTITTDQPQSTDLDISKLESEFQVDGPSIRQSYSNINGKSTSTKSWTYEVTPLKIGKFTIPSFSVGSEKTAPIAITVTKAPKISQTDDIFLKLSSKQKTAYVQEPFAITVKIYYNAVISGGSLVEPQNDQATLEQYQKDAQGREVVNGKNYNTLTRKYIVRANQSGKLTIDPFNLQAYILQTNQRNQTNRKRLNVQSNPITIDIKPEPASFSQSGDSWLPAKNLTLSDSWKMPQKIEVGTPITREITLKVLGLDNNQIPDLKLGEIDGAKSYQDNLDHNTSIVDDSYSTVRLLTDVIIPNRAGKINVPPVTIKWFNTKTNQAETATIAGKEFIVKGDANVPIAATAPTSPAPKNTQAPDSSDTETQSLVSKPSQNIWKLVSLILFIVWATTVIIAIYFLNKRKKPHPETDPAPEAPKQPTDLTALTNDNPSTIQKTLIDWWNNQQYPAITNLGQMVSFIDDLEIIDAINSLESSLYNKDSNSSQFDWKKAIKDKRIQPKVSQGDQNELLPKLYPISEE